MRRRPTLGVCAEASTYRVEELSTGALRMCGIVGLFCKSSELEPRLGELLSAMLVQMSDRGPDSAGVAVYRNPAPPGLTKLTLYSADDEYDWSPLEPEEGRARHAVVLAGDEARLRGGRPGLRVIGGGRVVGISKEG